MSDAQNKEVVISKMAVDLEEVVECLTELQKESRKFSVSYSSASQTLAYHLLLSDDTTIPTGGDISDIAIEVAYKVLPYFRVVPSRIAESVILLTIDEISVEEVGRYQYKITGSYKFDLENGGGSGQAGLENPTDFVLPQIRINFSVGNNTKHITSSLNGLLQSRVIPLPGFDTEPADQLSIGQSAEGVAGADIADEGLTIQITAYYVPSHVDFDFITTLKGLCARVNLAEFLGQDPEEVLFLGADGGGAIFDIIPITFTFLIKENQDDYDDGLFPVEDVKGHQLIDYMYVPSIDDNNGMQITLPAFRKIHDVYKIKSFAALGFGS